MGRKENYTGQYNEESNPNGWLLDKEGNKVKQDDVMRENVQEGAFSIDEYIWWCNNTDMSWDSISTMITGSIEDTVKKGHTRS